MRWCMDLLKEGILLLLLLRPLYGPLYRIFVLVSSLHAYKSSMLVAVINGTLLDTLQGTKKPPCLDMCLNGRFDDRHYIAILECVRMVPIISMKELNILNIFPKESYKEVFQFFGSRGNLIVVVNNNCNPNLSTYLKLDYQGLRD